MRSQKQKYLIFIDHIYQLPIHKINGIPLPIYKRRIKKSTTYIFISLYNLGQSSTFSLVSSLDNVFHLRIHKFRKIWVYSLTKYASTVSISKNSVCA